MAELETTIREGIIKTATAVLEAARTGPGRERFLTVGQAFYSEHVMDKNIKTPEQWHDHVLETAGAEADRQAQDIRSLVELLVPDARRREAIYARWPALPDCAAHNILLGIVRGDREPIAVNASRRGDGKVRLYADRWPPAVAPQDVWDWCADKCTPEGKAQTLLAPGFPQVHNWVFFTSGNSHPLENIARIYEVDRAIDRDSKRPITVTSVSRPTNRFVEALGKISTNQKRGPGGFQEGISNQIGPAENYVYFKIKDERQLRLPFAPGTVFDDALCSVMRDTDNLGVHGLKAFVALEQIFSEQGAGPHCYFSISEIMERCGYHPSKRDSRKEQDKIIARLNTLLKIELCITNKEAPQDEKFVYLFTKLGGERDKKTGAEHGFILQRNLDIFGGYRDKKGKLTGAWMPVLPGLAKIPAKYEIALWLGRVIQGHWHLAAGQDGKDHVIRSAEWIFKQCGTVVGNHPGRAFDQLEKNLDVLVKHGILGDWTWTQNPRTEKGTILLKMPVAVADRVLRGIRDNAALPPRRNIRAEIKDGPGLRKWRLEHKLSQGELAARLGVSRWTLIRAEKLPEGEPLPGSILNSLLNLAV